jgi:hypothetical protein
LFLGFCLGFSFLIIKVSPGTGGTTVLARAAGSRFPSSAVAQPSFDTVVELDFLFVAGLVSLWQDSGVAKRVFDLGGVSGFRAQYQGFFDFLNVR